mmetsp:Transcript_36735/g.37389  ORF Transcript_36735/g.37389 Transcript_36735/m.37389 type:complete len:277 (-) Transcript_36735:776-1606(-)
MRNGDKGGRPVSAGTCLRFLGLACDTPCFGFLSVSVESFVFRRAIAALSAASTSSRYCLYSFLSKSAVVLACNVAPPSGRAVQSAYTSPVDTNQIGKHLGGPRTSSFSPLRERIKNDALTRAGATTNIPSFSASLSRSLSWCRCTSSPDAPLTLFFRLGVVTEPARLCFLSIPTVLFFRFSVELILRLSPLLDLLGELLTMCLASTRNSSLNMALPDMCGSVLDIILCANDFASDFTGAVNLRSISVSAFGCMRPSLLSLGLSDASAFVVAYIEII